MNKTLFALALAATFMAAPAQASQELAQKRGCLACHSVEKKVLGPAFKDVATKYKGQDVAAKLSAKVAKGGSGVWGPIPMPANSPAVPDEDIATIVKWVLTL